MKRTFVIIATVFVGFGACPVSAQVFTVLHSFAKSDGAGPKAGLTASGNTLFGTTQLGGASDDGVVFTLNDDGSGFNVLHSFAGTDGEGPIADLFLAGNTLYGAAYQGGGNGAGTLFSLGTDGASFTNFSNLGGTPNVEDPYGGLLVLGNIVYGTTSTGRGAPEGVVFAVETNGANFTTRHIFDGTDGAGPECDLVLGGNELYGTTYYGGVSNLGTIFSVQNNGSNFVVLHSFSNTDGTTPTAGLVLSGGTLYGTASSGGAYNAGSVFSIKTSGAKFTVLHSFIQTPVAVSTDGAAPMAALILSSNVLYGTTSSGGTNGQGTVFSINTDGSNYMELHSFGANSLDGYNPVAHVILAGNSLYGTTEAGGAGQSGTVFGLQIAGVAFTTEPVGETNVAVGGNVVFTGVGESLSFPGAALQYQWRLNGVNIPGATTPELSFQDVQPTNGGTLTLTISDGINAATSVPVGFSVAIQVVASGNNAFANRFLLGELASGVVSSSNTNATRQAGEPEIIAGNPGGKSIWFQWQPETSGTAVFTTRGSDFDTIMGVYTGTNVTGLTRVPSSVNDDDYGGYLTSLVSFNCVAGTEYDITVDGYWGASGNVVLNWVTERLAAALPSLLQTPPRQTIASNNAAVTLVCQASSGTPTWFFNGQQTAVTGPDFVISPVGDSTVGTYVAQTTLGGGVASTEPAHVQTDVLEDGTSDSNSIAWNKFLDSANSPYSNPPQASIRKLGGGDTRGYSVSQTFSTVGATGEPGEPSIDGQIGGSPYWYTYVAPTNGTMIVNTAGSSFNTLLGVFIGSGESFATLTNIGAGYTTNRLLEGQPQIYIPSVAAGQSNFIVVDGYEGASGTVNLNIKLGNPVVIETAPQNQSVILGSNVTFSVDAEGSTPLSYLWQFSGIDIAGATNGTLTVSNVQSADIGVYTVVVSNFISSVSSSATLSVSNTILLDSASYHGSGFQFQLVGVPGSNYVIEYSPNLQTWFPLTTNTDITGFLQITDTNAGNLNHRFYRGVAN